MSCLSSSLKIFCVRPHPQSLLPGLLPTAAVAASCPLENSPDLSLQLTVKAVLAAALWAQMANLVLVQTLEPLLFLSLEISLCDKNIITYLVPCAVMDPARGQSAWQLARHGTATAGKRVNPAGNCCL